MVIRPLPNKLQSKAELELHEEPNRIPEDLQNIRDWLAKQPHLKCRTEDQWLLSFLRECHFSLQRTKEKIDMYYTTRSLVPEFFNNRDPFSQEIQECLKAGLIVILPNVENSPEPVIGIVRAASAAPEKVTLLTALKVSLMITDILRNENDNFSVAGQRLIFDLNGTTSMNLLQKYFGLLRKGITCLQNTCLTRLQDLHFINSSSIFKPVYNILKTLASKKTVDKVQWHMHDDLDAMCKYEPLSNLPKEYGGDGGSIDRLAAEWKLKVESYRDWFLEDAQYGCEESKRTTTPYTSNDIFGMEGSFRKLQVN